MVGPGTADPEAHRAQKQKYERVGQLQLRAEKDQQIGELKSENKELKQKNAEMETRLGALEKLMNRLTVAQGDAR